MRSPLLALTIALLSLSLTACGSSSTHASSSSVGASRSSVATQPARKLDRDGDTDNNSDDGRIFGFGHPADAHDKQAITTLLESYYHAAAGEDGARACSLLYPFIAEAVAENYGQTRALRGHTCAVVISKLFRSRHHLLIAQNHAFKLVTARVEGNKALAVLSFATVLPIRQITLRRDGDTWMLLELFDGLIE